RQRGEEVMPRTLLALLTVLVSVPAIWAGALAPPPPLMARLPRADAIVVGKVVSFEEKPIKADGTEYRIAVVKIEDALLGAKGLTHVKVGIRPPIQWRGSGGTLRSSLVANLDAGQ